MSKLEEKINALLKKQGLKVESQKRMTPVTSWPWKPFPRSQSPKCDLYLPDTKIYIEVKGFMTIHAMAKMSWFCRQSHIRYYILQGTEEDWNPFLNTPLCNERGTLPKSKQKIREQNITQQVDELIWLNSNDASKASAISLTRLKDYIETRIAEYTEWNSEWY